MTQTSIFYPATVLQRFLFGNEECMVFSCSDLPLPRARSYQITSHMRPKPTPIPSNLLSDAYYNGWCNKVDVCVVVSISSP